MIMKRCLYLPIALFSLCMPALATVTGQWDFDNGDLSATVGTDLAYRGDTDAFTTFTTATIGGQTAKVMAFPATTPDEGFIMTHGIVPNGGGSYVNQYTLIMDIMFPTSSSGVYRSLLQTSTANANDGDLFVKKDNSIGIAGGYSGTILPDTWYRVAFVFDLSLSSGQLVKYIDGVQVGSQVLAQPALDGRWSMDPTALLFTDDDGETAAGFVNSIQIHDVPLTASEVYSLGGASAAGIPALPSVVNLAVTVSPQAQTNVVGMTGTHFSAAAVGTGTLSYQWYKDGTAIPGQTDAALRLTNVQVSAAGSYTVVVGNGSQWVTSTPPAVLTINPAQQGTVTGQWDFNNGDLSATIGNPLEYFDAQAQSDTSFGTTTDLGISDIAGQPANVMFYSPAGSTWGGFIMSHAISPNGGGTNVNQYTVILDLMSPSSSSGSYRSLWQADPTDANDASVFINKDNGLGVSSTYNGVLAPDVWHRVVLAFDMTKREFGKYIDGTNVQSQATGSGTYGPNDAQYLSSGVDSRWSLLPTALLFADNDGEVQPVYVSSVQIRNFRMTDPAIAALGSPATTKIPGGLQVKLVGGNIVVNWSGAALESSASVTGPWSQVAGAAHPHTITAPTGNRFFRLKQ